MLVKKYRGGRQEDYVKTGFALSWDLPFLLFYLIFKVFFFSCRTLEIFIYFFLLKKILSFRTFVLCCV